MLYENLDNSTWMLSDYLALIGIIVSIVIATGIYLLQQRLSDKQKIDNQILIENKLNKKLENIRYEKANSKIQLYNSKLLNKSYFTENKRSRIWGYPYHGAELYSANFDGLEFVVGLEEIKGVLHYKVGIIPYDRILGIKPDGDESFNGTIFYVRPLLIQKDEYSISYVGFRYYAVPASKKSKS